MPGVDDNWFLVSCKERGGGGGGVRLESCLKSTCEIFSRDDMLYVTSS